MSKLYDNYSRKAEGVLLLEDPECFQPLIVHCADIAAWAAN